MVMHKFWPKLAILDFCLATIIASFKVVETKKKIFIFFLFLIKKKATGTRNYSLPKTLPSPDTTLVQKKFLSYVTQCCTNSLSYSDLDSNSDSHSNSLLSIKNNNNNVLLLRDLWPKTANIYTTKMKGAKQNFKFNRKMRIGYKFSTHVLTLIWFAASKFDSI